MAVTTVAVARQTVLTYADKLHDGAVAAFVTERREAGTALLELNFELRERFGVEVSIETLRSFIADLPAAEVAS